jgi:hypothetical protein
VKHPNINDAQQERERREIKINSNSREKHHKVLWPYTHTHSNFIVLHCEVSEKGRNDDDDQKSRA